MKIGIFCGFYPLLKGGAEYQATILANQLKKRHDVFFISVGHKENEILNIDGIRVYTLKLNHYLNTLFLYYPIRYKIFRILKKENPDIIYQRILNTFSYHLASYHKKTKVPLFIHIADNYCLLFNNSLRSLLKKLFFRFIVSSDVKFITQTKYQGQLLKTQNVGFEQQVYNMHPLPDSNLKEITSNEKIIIWIGSIRPVKQVEIFINLAQNLNEKRNLKFKIIGRIDQSEYGDQIKKLLVNTANIEYIGEKTNDYINNYLNKSYVLINTSQSEGFSNTFIQAWMRGVPVISLNSDPDNFIHDNNMGYICNGNTMLLKTLLLKILENKREYEIMKNTSKKVSFNYFSIENNFPILEKMLVENIN